MYVCVRVCVADNKIPRKFIPNQFLCSKITSLYKFIPAPAGWDVNKPKCIGYHLAILEYTSHFGFFDKFRLLNS